MLRSKNPTLLVCLAFVVSVFFAGAARGEQSEDLSQKNIKTSQVSTLAGSKDLRPKAITKVKPAAMPWSCAYPCAPRGITKVMPAYGVPYATGVQPTDCVLPTARVGQWDVSGGILFARLRGKIAWPRYPWGGAGWGGWWGWSDGTNLNDGLQLPGHMAVPTWSVKYQFRPHWALRYSGLGFEANGGGQPSDYLMFGNWQQFSGFGQSVQSKYQHGYHRLGLLYDAMNTCKSSVKVFADWVHADDRIEVASCISCGQNSVFSKSTDAAISGIEFQKCIKTAANGGALSWDCKAGAIFLDDVVGWDVQAGAQYAIPLNCGRSGYIKGGYRLVELKKSQNDYLLNNAVEGGFMEFGFIF